MLASSEHVMTIHNDLDVDDLQLRGSKQSSAKSILSMRMFVDSKVHVVRRRLYSYCFAELPEAATSLCLSSRMLQLSELVRRLLGNPTRLFCQHHVQASTSTCLPKGFASMDPLSGYNADQRLLQVTVL